MRTAMTSRNSNREHCTNTTQEHIRVSSREEGRHGDKQVCRHAAGGQGRRRTCTNAHCKGSKATDCIFLSGCCVKSVQPNWSLINVYSRALVRHEMMYLYIHNSNAEAIQYRIFNVHRAETRTYADSAALPAVLEEVSMGMVIMWPVVGGVSWHVNT